MADGAREIFFQVDDAWPAGVGGIETVDVQEEAKALRFISTPKKIEAFAKKYADRMRPFTLCGSGDFHHLSALWTRQFTEPFLLVSFDHHPDWVTSGPKWSCGAWINRALENRQVRGVSVWGCGDDCDVSELRRANSRRGGRWQAGGASMAQGAREISPLAAADHAGDLARRAGRVGGASCGRENLHHDRPRLPRSDRRR